MSDWIFDAAHDRMMAELRLGFGVAASRSHAVIRNLTDGPPPLRWTRIWGWLRDHGRGQGAEREAAWHRWPWRANELDEIWTGSLRLPDDGGFDGTHARRVIPWSAVGIGTPLWHLGDSMLVEVDRTGEVIRMTSHKPPSPSVPPQDEPWLTHHIDGTPRDAPLTG